MRILQLCKKFPYPLKDGESLAITYLAKALNDLGTSVTLLAMNTSKHPADLSVLPADFDFYAGVHAVDVDNRIRPLAALQNLFSEKSYHIQRFEHEGFAEKLRDVLLRQRFDVIQLETLYLAPYLPIIREYAPKALVALRAHNVEHEIWERIAANGGNLLKQWYLQKITPRLKRFEEQTLNQYDLLIGITARDVEHFQRLGLRQPSMAVPIGLDCRDYQPDYSSFEQPLSLSFIGSLDWMPNVEGLKWFLDSVWPSLRNAFPELTFHIAGRNTPGWLRRLQLPGVHVAGEVPDAPAFLNRHSVMVVPLLSGGGMRAKILEGLALGKVVLSTRIGMEGIPARPRREALLADTPEDFVQMIRWCYAQGPSLADLGRRARQFCVAEFDNRETARRLLDVYEEMLRGETVAA